MYGDRQADDGKAPADQPIPEPSCCARQQMQLRRAPIPRSSDIPKRINTNRLDVFNGFLARYLPRHTVLNDHSLQWLGGLALGQTVFGHLEDAADALGTVVMARSLNDAVALLAGMELYGKALAQLRHGKLTARNWHGLLMTALVLQIYEAVESSASAGDGWMRHAVGICSILQHTVGSIFFERPTLLATREWQTVPWEQTPKTDFHRLLDVSTQVAALLHASTTLSQQPGNTSSQDPATFRLQASQFYEHRHQLDLGLDQWWEDMNANGKDRPLFWTQPLGSDDDGPLPEDAPFTHRLCYQKLTDAQMLIMYWEAKLQCHKAALRVAGNSCLPPNSGAPKDGEIPSPQLHHYADSICQSCAYMQAEEFGILGMHYTIMPLLAARHFYAEAGSLEKQNWCDVKIANYTITIILYFLHMITKLEVLQPTIVGVFDYYDSAGVKGRHRKAYVNVKNLLAEVQDTLEQETGSRLENSLSRIWKDYISIVSSTSHSHT
ncbi:hypothetical protein LEL_02391 [Akanthomyces lecanii RCEF 1005]|uniref:C6 finger domain protein n=1 Tax=Akanthomyces lecanii RCEF 1005 TaxID=1081108 RepID=A0A162IW02_CORDF|nr:hypothetical protein LEL_02391 [Akanthomyces lecanii RCEF 1005]